MAWEHMPGNSAGAMNGDGSRKLLLHSTEGTNIEGAFGAYRKNNSWPTFTVDCRKRRVVRHLPDTIAARSLRNLSGGIETNRDGTILIQIELMGFAGSPESIGDRDDLVWLGTEVVGPLCRRNAIPIATSVRWAPYPASYGTNAPQRLSASAWDSYSGVLGHQHAPENTHGDPGAIDIATILSAARGEDDMAWTQTDWDRMSRLVDARIAEATDDIADAVLAKLNTDAFDDEAQGSPFRVETLRLVRRGVNEALGAPAGDDDPGKLAAELATINTKLDALSVPPVPNPDVPPA
jgi:hypothetical protein